MSSFAVNRKQANKGVGVKPGGVWFFEEFMFSDAVFGTATVKYRVQAWKWLDQEIAEGDTSKPYGIIVYEPEVTELKVFDDNGEELTFGRELWEAELKWQVLDAFKAVLDDVVEFERSLL